MKKRLVILFICLFLVAVVLILNGTLFVVRSIDAAEYYGEEFDKEKVISSCGIQTGKNIFTISEDLVIKNIEINNPLLKVLAVARNFPDSIEITVMRRKPLLCIAYKDKYCIVDRELSVMEITATPPKEIVTVLGVVASHAGLSERVEFAYAVNSERLVRIIDVFERMNYDGENFVSVVDKLILDNDSVSIVMRSDGEKSGSVLKFNASTDLTLKVQALVSFYNSYPEYRYGKEIKAEQKSSSGSYIVVME